MRPVSRDADWSAAGVGSHGGAPDGTGLSIVRALVADELQGSFALAGARAEVVFPA